eukprot:GHVS01027662.1.p1 GENE.GHVS01027662.1~~GHVS01027662.1.p1  ORF type:complete len:683 (-),score=89.52 GHVS01027662.1:806-2854(-)
MNTTIGDEQKINQSQEVITIANNNTNNNNMSFRQVIISRYSYRISKILLLLLISKPLFLHSVVVNPFLAQSAWPIAQLNNYAQASSPLEGPVAAGNVDVLFHTEVAGALTVLYTEDDKVVWGSSLTSVFKVDRSDPSGMKLIASKEKPKASRQKDTFRGIYSVLTKDGYFFISSGNTIFKYTDSEIGNSMSGIKLVKSYEYIGKEKERVLALNLTFDGFIVFITNQGGVGVMSTDLEKEPKVKHATEASAPAVSVTNSVSIDEFGGIYVVTSAYMHRMWWDSTTQQLHSLPPRTIPPPIPAGVEDPNKWIGLFGSFGIPCGGGDWREKHCQVWSTPYAVHDEPINGRPTKVGSGTTPTLLKDSTTGDIYVVIADGQLNQQVLAISSRSGKIVATAPVDFRDSRSSESYTEQSILVSGNKLLLTQNALTDPGQRLNSFLEHIHATDIVASMNLPEVVQENVYLLPVLLGDSPRGFQQFQLLVTPYESPAQQEPLVELRETWTRNDIGCPNSIPTMSQPTGVMYCVGKSTNIINEVVSMGMTAGWTVEAFDWSTGESIFSAETGGNLLYNSLYAATQIGPEKEIIYGSTGGLVRIRAPPASSPTTSGRTGSHIQSLLGSSIDQLVRGTSRLSREANLISSAAQEVIEAEIANRSGGRDGVGGAVGGMVGDVGEGLRRFVVRPTN